MDSFPFEPLTALEQGRLLQERKLSAPELTRAYLQRIESREPFLHAYITQTAELALSQAEALQARLDAGEALSPLAGVPAAVKDNLCTKGVRTTAGSRMLETFVPPYDAVVMERFCSAGGILLGKTNLDEFAMGCATDTSFAGATRNPWDPSRTAGGSSGGSAAAVAGGMAAWAIGSDTGGSVRQPASYCNLSGIKPTYGTLSRYGLIAYASSFDQIGTLGKDILDAAAALELLSGTNLPLNIPSSFEGLTIGLPEGWLKEAFPDVQNALWEALRVLEAGGAKILPLSLPELDFAVPAYYTIACAEASSNLARYDGIRYGHRSAEAETLQELYLHSRTEAFGPEVKRRILLGSFVLSAGHFEAYYKKAQAVRRQIAEALSCALQKCDLILSPAALSVAPKLGGLTEDPLAQYRDDLYTVPANLAGLPAITVPCGFSSAEGLPLGMQLLGKAGSEALLIETAALWQRLTDHHKKSASQTNWGVAAATTLRKRGAAK